MSDLRASTAQGKAQPGLIYNKVCVSGAGEYQRAASLLFSAFRFLEIISGGVMKGKNYENEDEITKMKMKLRK